MYRVRVIPVLLLKDKGLVKSVKFKNYRYIGDPINAVKIFNDLYADELVFLDINATKENRSISVDFVKEIGDESNMPFAVGGGIQSIEKIKELINAGAEKVIINSHAVLFPEFISDASKTFGSSTVVVSIDVKKNIFGKYRVYIKGGSKSTNYDPIEFARLMEKNGAGEIIINSIEKDGLMTGYDLKLIDLVSRSVNIPVIAVGGAGELEHLKLAINANASAVAAGSLFVYHGSRKGCLSIIRQRMN